MNFSLTPYYEDIIGKAIELGVYANASEAVRASLRLLEKELLREARLRDLRAAMDEGEASGDPVPLDMEKIKRNARAQWEKSQPGTNG